MRVLSFNVKGLSEVHTLNYLNIIESLKLILSSIQPNILILTETHHNIHKLNQTNSLHSQFDSAGVSIYIYDRSIVPEKTVICPSGRFTYFEFKHMKQLFKLLAVYAPGSITPRRKWYKNNFPYNLTPNIIIGDLNIKSESKSTHPNQKSLQYETAFLNYLEA